jgi:hypothetical protein
VKWLNSVLMTIFVVQGHEAKGIVSYDGESGAVRNVSEPAQHNTVSQLKNRFMV